MRFYTGFELLDDGVEVWLGLVILIEFTRPFVSFARTLVVWMVRTRCPFDDAIAFHLLDDVFDQIFGHECPELVRESLAGVIGPAPNV
jgi:hypothetical protein